MVNVGERKGDALGKNGRREKIRNTGRLQEKEEKERSGRELGRVEGGQRKGNERKIERI